MIFLIAGKCTTASKKRERSSSLDKRSKLSGQSKFRLFKDVLCRSRARKSTPERLADLQNMHGQRDWSRLFALRTFNLLRSMRPFITGLPFMPPIYSWNCQNLHVLITYIFQFLLCLQSYNSTQEIYSFINKISYEFSFSSIQIASW